MTKKDLILNLIRYRFTQIGVELDMSLGEAAIMAEQRMRSEGLFGLLAGAKVHGTPEGAIVAIVETFFKLYIPQLERDPDLAKGRLKEEESCQREHKIQSNIFWAIEKHRSQLCPGEADIPINLRAYVNYRIYTEMRSLHHVEPEEIGLSFDIIDQMVTDSANFFKLRLGEFRK